MSRFLPLFILVTIALVSAAIARWFFGQSFWLVFCMVFFTLLVSILANVFMISLEDGMPGGWGNPSETEPLPWVRRVRKIIWWTFGILVLLLFVVWLSRQW